MKFIMGLGLHKCFNVLIQLGHAFFATSHSGINLSNIPTEGRRNLMKIGGLNSRSVIDLPFAYSPKKGPDTLND